MHTINLDFNGYWRYQNKGGIPNYSGVYLVYRCVYNREQETVSLKQLIYIGESENVHDRIQNHNKDTAWKRKLQDGEEICFACANVDNPDRERAEAALIYHTKPVLNDKSTESFDYPATYLVLTGQHRFLDSEIVVK